MARHPIHIFYRLILAYIEPFLAAVNAFYALFDPVEYLDSADPNVTYSPSVHRTLLDQLAGCYLLFALIGVVLLRRTRDVGVWRDVSLCTLPCDALHLWGIVDALGWEVLSDPGRWRGKDYGIVGISVGLVLVRVGLLMGIGVDESVTERKRR